MGAWGTGILENDSTVDYLIEINTLWNLQIEKKQIQKALEKKHLEDGDKVLDYDIDKYADFWTAIAFAEWLYEKPRDEVINKVEKIINSGKGFDCWGVPKERMQSIESFLQILQNPREKTERNPLKIWYWENAKRILDNEYTQQLGWEYSVLDRLGVKNKNEILLNKYEPLTEDFEEAIFWATIGKCESELGKISEEVIRKLEQIENNPNSMNLIKVAYNENQRIQIMDSLRGIKYLK